MKMKIAFDCLGTLQGRDSAKVVALYRALQSKGHDMYVWSSDFSMAMRLNRELKLEATVQGKVSKSEAADEGEGLLDIAIDDDQSQTWLAAKYIVLVRDIPSKDVEAFADKLINLRSQAR
jgi:hypothetical protein